ncbi:MAG: heme ABC transporter permease CcmC [Pseudomonadota bacterium]
MWKWFHQLASPPHIYRLAGFWAPWMLALALIGVGVGLYGGLIKAPADYQQGDAFRIIYVHVPSAYLSLLGYVIMAVASVIGLIWRMKLAHAVAVSAAPIGASFTFLALATGSLWGKPMWGTWWEWSDPRMMTELILLFLYLGYMTLHSAIEDRTRADRAGAVLAIVGVVNVVIVHYSVEWWSSLHQGQTVMNEDAVMPASMLTPLLIMIVSFSLFFGAVLFARLRSEVLLRERNARWVKRLVTGDASSLSKGAQHA